MSSDRKHLSAWVQDVLAAEHFVHECSERLVANDAVTADVAASFLSQLVHSRSRSHIDEIQGLLEQLDQEPSGVRRAIGATLGAMLGWVERLPSRDLVQVVRDLYVALNYTAAGYHVLYARAVLLERPAAAGLALRNLRDYTPAIRQLSELLAWASGQDLTRGRPDRTLEEVVEALVDSWSSEITNR